MNKDKIIQILDLYGALMALDTGQELKIVSNNTKDHSTRLFKRMK